MTSDMASLLALAGDRGPKAELGGFAGAALEQRLGQLESFDAAKAPTLRVRLVLPRDPEQVQGIHIPQPDACEAIDDLGRYEGGVPHLGKGGNRDAALPGPCS